MTIVKLRIFHVVFLIVTVLIVSGCATMEQFSKKYAGYTVVDKERRPVTIDVPVWILSCVRPNGAVRCQVESVGMYPDAGVNQCTMSCKGGEDKWDKRQTGTKKETSFEYIVKLKSPTGNIVEDKVTLPIFNEIREGQVFSTIK